MSVNGLEFYHNITKKHTATVLENGTVICSGCLLDPMWGEHFILLIIKDIEEEYTRQIKEIIDAK